MGCFASKEAVGEAYLADNQATPPQKRTKKKSVTYVDQDFIVRSTANSVTHHVRNCAHESITLGVHRSINSMTSLPAKAMSKSFVGADLHSIVDDKGTLNPLVSRQLSMMSHYSVRSESGSVLITPEDVDRPFKLLKLIGRGGFGNVYLGDWENKKVAIKVIAGNTNSEQPEESEWEQRKERMAQMEAILMSAINHPNIVRTHKVTSTAGDQSDPELAALEHTILKETHREAADQHNPPSFEWHIIMEYCDKGSMSKALSTFRFHEAVDSVHVRWDAWASIETLKEVVRALQFLHEHRILHGDLKAANVLLTSSDQDRRGYVAKVSDFGLSRVLNTNKNHIKTQTFGTVTHMPPELLCKGTLSPSADVYAVGVLMWEVYTAEKVFKQLSDSEVILAVVTKKARPIFPSDTPARYKFLAERCWSEMPELRPNLDQLMHELEVLQKNLCPNGQQSEKPLVKAYPTKQRVIQSLAAAAAAAGGSSSQKSLHAPVPTSRLANVRGSNDNGHAPSPLSPSSGQLVVSPKSLGAPVNPSRAYKQHLAGSTNAAVQQAFAKGNRGSGGSRFVQRCQTESTAAARMQKAAEVALAEVGKKPDQTESAVLSAM